jgi:hypothetical protein
MHAMTVSWNMSPSFSLSVSVSLMGLSKKHGTNLKMNITLQQKILWWKWEHSQTGHRRTLTDTWSDSIFHSDQFYPLVDHKHHTQIPNFPLSWIYHTREEMCLDLRSQQTLKREARQCHNHIIKNKGTMTKFKCSQCNVRLCVSLSLRLYSIKFYCYRLFGTSLEKEKHTNMCNKTTVITVLIFFEQQYLDKIRRIWRTEF